MHYIYIVRSSINEKVYIGKTNNFSKRRDDHRYCARKGDTRPLYCAMRDLGLDSFFFDVLEECENDIVATEREKYWISYHDSFNNGYNLTPSGGYHVGNKGRKFSEDHRRKLSKAHKGKIVSEKTRQKMSEAAKGRTISEEHKEKIRQANFKRDYQPVTEETKQKISEKFKGRHLSEETIKKIVKANTGKIRSEEICQKIKDAAKRREEKKRNEDPSRKKKFEQKLENESKPSKFSDEHRRKLSEAAKRRYKK